MLLIKAPKAQADTFKIDYRVVAVGGRETKQVLSSWVCKDEILALGHSYGFDVQHAALVNCLALRFFDQLQAIHHMGATERLWLSTAAWLHDIGKPQGSKDHHKRAQAIILHDRTLPLNDESRHMIAWLVRYHRGAPPYNSASTKILDAETRRYLSKLTALLRLADALDRRGKGLVKDILCRVDEQYVYLDIIASQPFSLCKFHRKAILFTKIFPFSFLPQVLVFKPEENFLLDSPPTGPYAECL